MADRGPLLSRRASHKSLIPLGLSELSIKHGHDMTPLRESAAEFINACFLRQLGYQMAGNQIAKLPETTEL
jgi:hypothetical protein